MTFEEYKKAITEIWTKYEIPIPSDEAINVEWERDRLKLATEELNDKVFVKQYKI